MNFENERRKDMIGFRERRLRFGFSYCYQAECDRNCQAPSRKNRA